MNTNTKNKSWPALNVNNNHNDGRAVGCTSDASDEIDLIELFVRGANFFKQYNTWFLAAAIFGFFTGMTFFFTMEPRYKSEFVFGVSVLERTELEQLIKQVNTHIADGNVEMIRKLDIDPHMVRSVSLNEGEEEATSYTISVTVQDPEYLPKLQQALIAYIGNNDFTKREILAERNAIHQTLETLEQEQIKVDQVLNNVAAVNGTDQFMNVADIFKLKIDIQKEKIELENKLKHLESVTVIQDFPQYAQPYNKNFALISGIGVAGMLFLTLIFAGGKELGKMAHQYRHQNGMIRFKVKDI